MGFDAIRFLTDYNITYWTQGKNVQDGWVNITCPNPECNDKSQHGGFNIMKGYYNCWKCGHQSLRFIISLLTGESNPTNIINEYMGSTIIRKRLNKKVKSNVTNIKLPGTELKKMHRKYLLKRGFDPDYIEKKYKIKGTGITGDWKYRIIIPIYYKGQLVSYQGRDITDQQELRYKTLSKDESIINPKHVLYNLDNCKEEYIIVTEGAFDCWRLGNDSCATLGTSITKEQLRLLRKYKKIFFIFDPESEAYKKAKKAANELAIFGCKTEIIKLDEASDPAELSDIEAKKLKRKLLYEKS